MNNCKLTGQTSNVVFKAKVLTSSCSSFVPLLLLLAQHKGSYRRNHRAHQAPYAHRPTPSAGQQLGTSQPLSANRIQPQLSSLFQGLKFLSGSNPDSHICRTLGVGFVEGCEVTGPCSTPPSIPPSLQPLRKFYYCLHNQGEVFMVSLCCDSQISGRR